MTTLTTSQPSAQDVIDRLVSILGVDTTQVHINMCIATRRSRSEAETADATLDVLTYLAANLGHRLHADEAIALTTSIVNMDYAITSVDL